MGLWSRRYERLTREERGAGEAEDLGYGDEGGGAVGHCVEALID